MSKIDIKVDVTSVRKQAFEEAALLCENNIEEIGRTRSLAPFDHDTQGLHAGMTYATANTTGENQ